VSSEQLAAARDALARGDVLVAYDLAVGASRGGPTDLEARYVAALALARSGALDRAAPEAARLRHDVDRAATASVRLREDSAALEARISKDLALRAPPGAQPACFAEAADRYEATVERFNRHYACINAATMRLLAGEVARAHELARRALELASTQPLADAETRYWAAATTAEAHLIRRDVGAARQALKLAASLSTGDWGARAATRRQLEVVCSVIGVGREILDVLRVPAVIHYCGHLIAGAAGLGRFPIRLAQQVSADVAAYLDDRAVGFAYGSLACGADTIVAEAVLARGGELHVVLPFHTAEFEKVSVEPAGAVWLDRFRACLARATSVIHASDSAYLGDDGLFGYASRIAMGHAINRAQSLGSEVEQLAIWDEKPPVSGTERNIDIWRRTGRPTHVTSLRSRTPPPGAPPETQPTHPPRAIRAVMFADFRGFSGLYDEHYPAVLQRVFQPLAAVVDRYGENASWRNTWGDAVVVVFDDVVAAARCALELQEAVQTIDLVACGLPPDLSLRIGVHAGPILHLADPFCGADGWWGREMTRAARIEPRTPEGEVYGTDALAALIAIEPSSGIACDYVGRVTTAKEFETIPMYRLRRE